MVYNNDKPLEVKSAKQTRKEYAETPFDFYTLKQSGSEIEIVESLDFENDKPRVVKVKNFKKQGDTSPDQYHDAIAIKVSDGVFTKDLNMRKDEWIKLCAAFPSTLANLKGVTFRLLRGHGFDTKVEYLRVAIQDMEGKPYNTGNTNSNKIAASMEKAQPTQPSPTTIASMIQALHAAIDTNINTGIKNTPEVVLKAAELIKPGDGAHLIQAAKDAGWIVEVGGVIRGT